VDIGCASGYISRALEAKQCRITGIDQFAPAEDLGPDRFIKAVLDHAGFPLDAGSFDYVLLPNVIEQVDSPGQFLDSLRHSRTMARTLK